MLRGGGVERRHILVFAVCLHVIEATVSRLFVCFNFVCQIILCYVRSHCIQTVRAIQRCIPNYCRHVKSFLKFDPSNSGSII